MTLQLGGNGAITGCTSLEEPDLTVSAITVNTGGIVLPNGSPGIQFGGVTGTATSTTLDEYEEGTWTPVLSVNGTDSTSTISLTGNYVKIGRIVWLSILAQQANTVPLNWNVGWTSITGSPFSIPWALSKIE